LLYKTYTKFDFKKGSLEIVTFIVKHNINNLREKKIKIAYSTLGIKK